MLSVGAIIWNSVRPLIRLVLCAGSGFVITKAGIFPIIAARGAGQIMLNIALPCLMFSRIVSAFTSDNINALGPLVFIALLYEALGIAMAWIIKQFFWTPHRFRHGILVAGGWGNWADVPTSVIMGLTAGAPFNGTADQTLSVAYISVFILVFMVTLFPCGGHRWVAKDYVGPDIEDEEVREQMRQRRRKILFGWMRLLSIMKRKVHPGIPIVDVEEIISSNEKASSAELSKDKIGCEKVDPTAPSAAIHQGSAAAAESTKDSPISVAATLASDNTSPTPTMTLNEPSGKDSILDDANPRSLPVLATSLSSSTASVVLKSSPPASSRLSKKPIWPLIKSFLLSLCVPASLAIVIAFPIAVVPKLKALFVDVPGANIPPAPDGQPPLAFITDTTSFIGAASVPLGLICVGSALARLKVPKNQWSTLPLGAISGMAVGRLLIMPVLGVLIVRGLINVGMIPREDKVLQLVCMFFACVPTGTTQVFLTQVYSGTGSADHLAAFLIPQYSLMFLSVTGLTGYCLSTLF